MSRVVDLDRVRAFAELLAQPDERALQGQRGHRVTAPGSRDRLLTTWLPAVRTWSQHRIGESMGAEDGWHSARRDAFAAWRHVRLMPLLQIYQDSRGKGQCRSCGAPITWAELTSGKRMPFDGEIVPVRTQGNILDGRVIEIVDTDVTASHFSTCPDAKDWRKNR